MGRCRPGAMGAEGRDRSTGECLSLLVAAETRCRECSLGQLLAWGLGTKGRERMEVNERAIRVKGSATANTGNGYSKKGKGVETG